MTSLLSASPDLMLLSLFAVCFCSAQGNVKEYQLWVISKRDNTPYPLIGMPLVCLTCHGGSGLILSVFDPLGYKPPKALTEG